ncbi:MAG: hypothetical protein H3C30_19525 [Candidatus Hydrogenedentes bacterium]|nr:hypothetical protein [Candidatus Hydrogenedentota bacterium]
MAINTVPLSPKPLPVNPYCVYYHDPSHDKRRELIDSGAWWTEEQARWIRDYLDVPTEFGDPLVAVMLCVVGYEKHSEDCTMWMGGHDDSGGYVMLHEVLGAEDGNHICRCRNSAYMLRDAVEWQSVINIVGDIDYARRFREANPNIPMRLWTDDDPMPDQLPWYTGLTLPALMTWANRHRVPMTEAGAFKWAEIVRSGCPPLVPVAENDWAYDPNAPLMCSVADKFNEARGIPIKWRQVRDPLKVALDYREGWTPELGNRLRAALRVFGMRVVGDPVEVPECQTNEATADIGDSVPVRAKGAKGKGRPGRGRANEGWEVAAFAVELQLIEAARQGNGVSDVNCVIVEGLPKELKKNRAHVEAMRRRHKDRARRDAESFAEKYNTRKQAVIGKDRWKEIQKIVKDNHWEAYLRGGHSGDWTTLEAALDGGTCAATQGGGVSEIAATVRN